MTNHIRYNELIEDIIDLQNKTDCLKWDYKKYINDKEIEQALKKFKHKYCVADEWIYPIAANRVTVDDLEFLIQNGLIKNRYNKRRS